MSNAFRHAVGDYAVYLADDDLLAPAGVENAIRYLDANPDVVACQAPWYLHDEVRGVDVSTFYQVEENRKFERQDFVELFQYIYDGHIFPEIGIYRTSALRSAWVPREFCYWAFAYLAHFLDAGAVTFLKEPFYRSVTASTVALSRQQAGHEAVMTSWDSYRAGLEYFLHIAAKRGKLNLSDDARAIYDQMCKFFTMNRMAVAIRFWVGHKDYGRAYELYTRLAIGGMAEHPEIVDLRRQFPVMVALQTLAYEVNSATDLTHLVLSGVSDPAYVGGLLRDLGLRADVTIVSDPADYAAIPIEKIAIFAGDMDLYADFVAQGFSPAFIFTEETLAKYVLI